MVLDLDPVGQGLEQQAPGAVALVLCDELRTVVTELGFFQQLAITVIRIGGTTAIKAGFLSDQSARRVVQPIGVADLVFDLGEQQLRMIVAVLQRAAVGVDPTADQVQVVGVFVTGYPSQFVGFGGDLAVGVVAIGTAGTGGQRDPGQSTHGVPLIAGDGTVFVLPGNPPAQHIVGKSALGTVRQGLLQQLPQGVPDKPVTALIGESDCQQAPLGVVEIAGDLPVGIGNSSDVALGIALTGPGRLTTGEGAQETVPIVAGHGRLIGRTPRDQPTGFVIMVFGDGAEGVLLGDQATLIVVGLVQLTAVGPDLAYQACAVVMNVNLFATVGVVHCHTAFIVPGVTCLHLRKRGPMMDAAGCLARAFPRPEETRAAGQLPLQDHVLLVVVIALAFTCGVGCLDQAPAGVVAVADQCLFGAPGVCLAVAALKHLIVDGHQVLDVVTQQ
ncbi:hypothetical protein D3C86_1215400 [compost metagenome]